jgi:hypothetical protein
VTASTESTRVLAPASVSIRPARPADIPWLIVQLREFSKFNDVKYEVFGDEGYAAQKLVEMMERHYFSVAERGNELLGFLAGYYVPHPFNPQIITLVEMFWWVASEHRCSRAGLMLLDDYVAWGKRHANWITFALQSNSPVNPKTLLKRGFIEQERSYLLEVL